MSRFGTTLGMLRFAFKNRKYLRLLRQYRESLKAPLTLANMELGKMGYGDVKFAQHVQEFNQAVIELYKGRWYATQALKSGSKVDWKRAIKHIKVSQKLSEALLKAVQSGESTPIDFEPATLTTNGTEIHFADGVPLVPEICPVIILQGSDYDMGYQYAQQLIQIFGPWILEQKANREFSEEELTYMQSWEAQILEYAPEIVEMCKGWVAGATDAGVEMTYEDVLDLWTGHIPPAKDYFGIDQLVGQLPPIACSGAAAWGQATEDGKLVTGSTGDHDCTYMVTIVAFPETGNNFIYTPFGATGDVPLIGPCYFFGHPGMNNKGLAYVHHGGGPKLLEPKESWGYGLRRAVSVLHILRFADNALEAREMEMSYPIGDIGPGDQAHVGGFYADSTYGYVIESRKDPVIIREAGMMGETDFLYANNSAIHPDVSQAEWMQNTKDEWLWDENGGWYPKEFAAYKISVRGSIEKKVMTGLKMTYHNSYARNLYFYKMLKLGVGHINFEYMKMLFRKSGSLPPGAWKDIVANYNKTGQWGEVSTGNPSNALVTIMKPQAGDKGLYAICTGTAARGLSPISPTMCNPIYGETNAFLELTLASTPAGVTKAAKRKAKDLIDQALMEFEKLEDSNPTHQHLKELLKLANKEFEAGKTFETLVTKTNGNARVYSWAKATRAYTRAQVRASQVHQALVPPPNKPEDFSEQL